MSVGETFTGTLSDGLDREEDSRSHHDKRQSHQENEVVNKNNGFEGESTSTESSSYNDDRRQREEDDQEFGLFDYTNENEDETSVHEIVDDKQEEKDINSFYGEEESIEKRKQEQTIRSKWYNLYKSKSIYVVRRLE